MGTIKQGILGGFSGKVGSVVGSSWKGIAVMKAKPLSVANPRSSKQTAQRGKFSHLVFIATSILTSTIKPLWDRFSLKQSGYNAFISANYAAYEGTETLNYSKLVLSKGKMSKTEFFDCIYNQTSGDLSIGWQNDSGTDFKLPNDLSYSVAIVESDPIQVFTLAQATRAQEGALTSIGAGITDPIHVYLSFRRQDGTVVSDSNYSQAS